jgi:hypothetical protein
MKEGDILQPIIPIEFKKKCVKLSETGISTKDIYADCYCKEYGSASLESFSRLLRKWKSKVEADDKTLEAGNLGYKFTPHASTVQVNSEGQVVQAWIKSHTNDDLYIELINEVKKNTPHEHIEVAHKPDASGMLEIPFFDMHWGIADLDYYRDTLNNVLALIDRKIYDEIVVIIGQDSFHNDNFNGTTTKGTPIEKVNMVKAWQGAKTFWYNIIDKALERANKVKVIYSKGNHDKTVCWAFMQMLKERYGDIVDDGLEERKTITYGRCFIGLTHGEFKRNKPSDLRSQFSVKFPIEFANATVKEIHTGHLHSEKEEDNYQVMCRRLSSGNKDDEWTEREGYSAIKRFMVFEWSLDKLVAIYYV